MIVWMGLGIVLGALLCIGAFAYDAFGVRSMIEQDIRDAYDEIGPDQVWDAFTRRKEDEWPQIRPGDPEIDAWDVFQSPAPERNRYEEDDFDPWTAFNSTPEPKKQQKKGKGDA